MSASGSWPGGRLTNRTPSLTCKEILRQVARALNWTLVQRSWSLGLDSNVNELRPRMIPD